MSSYREYLLMLIAVGAVSGCQALGVAPVSSGDDESVNAEAKAVPAVIVRSQGVNLQDGMPVRTTIPRVSDSPYPLAKAGFSYRQVPLWPALQLAPVGQLATVEDPGFLPPPVRAIPVVKPEPPSQICATAAVASGLDAGPRQNWVMRKARSFTQLLWGGWSDDTPEEAGEAVGTVNGKTNAFSGQRFNLPEPQTSLVLRGQFSSRGLQLTSALASDQEQPVIHMLYLEQRDCQRAWPDRWQVELLWPSAPEAEERERAFNPGAGGFHASPEGSHKLEGNSDRARLTHYQRMLLDHAPDPAWRQLGFSEPEQGVQVLGSHFSQVGPASILEDTVLVIHVARPKDKRYRTDALVYRMKIDANGALQFRPL